MTPTRWESTVQTLFGEIGGTHTLFIPPNLKGFVRETDKLEVGSAELRDVVYLFYKNELAMVLLQTPLTEHHKLRDQFDLTFGRGEDNYKYRENGVRYYHNTHWAGVSTTAAYGLLYGLPYFIIFNNRLVDTAYMAYKAKETENNGL